MIVSLLALLQSVVVPAAQGFPPRGGPSALCQVSEIGSPEQGRAAGQVTILYVGCGQSAVRIGKVDSYRSSYNPAVGALAVTIREAGRTRVLVVRSAADGTVEVQDVSRDLAKLAGQPANVELRSLDVDLEGFAGDGTIAASRAGQGAPKARLMPDHYRPPAAERRQASPGELSGGEAQ